MSFVKAIIGIVVAVIMVSAVLIPTMQGVNDTDWSSAEKSLFSMGITFAIIGLLFSIAAAFGLV